MDFSFYDWEPLLGAERVKSYFPRLQAQVEAAYAGERAVYPPRELLFEALRLTPPARVRCVILGQDPYHEPGQAHGLSFSVTPGTPLPRSLSNICRELASDLGEGVPPDGSLTAWAEEGVLLLNSVLTVYAGAAGSHRGFGWQHLTDAVLAAVDALPQSVAFVLWGGDARKKAGLITPAENHLLIESAHPSPLSVYRGFYGSRPFSRVNAFLLSRGEEPILWI